MRASVERDARVTVELTERETAIVTRALGLYAPNEFQGVGIESDAINLFNDFDNLVAEEGIYRIDSEEDGR